MLCISPYRLKSFPLMILLLAALMFPGWACALQSGDFFYSVTSSNTVTISDYIGPGGALAVPSLIDSKNVTRIGDYTFFNRSLTSVTIPDSVTNIGRGAFKYCGFLTSVTIPDSVTSIGPEAFYHCERLPSVTIPDSVTSIESLTFELCTRLTSITIGNSVTSIGELAFLNCSSLVSLFFLGNAPSEVDHLFTNAPLESVFCHDGTTGWGATYAGVPTVKCKFMSINANGGGTVSWSPDALTNSPSTSSNLWYEQDTSITLVAHPTSDSFRGWSGGATGTAVTTVVTVNSDASINAWFGDYDSDSDTISDYDEASVYSTDPFEDDSDGDGILDGTELNVYGTEPTLKDSDNDGLDDGDELIAGTSPTNSTDVFQIAEALSRTNHTDCILNWDTVSNRTYSIYSHTNLTTTWPTTPVFQIQGDGTQKSYTNNTSGSSRYFRIGVELNP